MLDGGSASGMIDSYARLWHCSSTIFYYPHCLMLEPRGNSEAVNDIIQSGVAAKSGRGQKTRPDRPGAGMPDTAREDQMKVYLAWNLASGYPQQRVWSSSGEN